MPESQKAYTLNAEGKPIGPRKIEEIKRDYTPTTYVWGPQKNQWTLATLMFKPTVPKSTSSMWYILDAEQNPQGPFDVPTLCDQFQNGEITDSTHAWSSEDEYGEVWRKIRDLPSLEGAINLLRKANAFEKEFENEMPETPTDGFLSYLQLLAELQLDGNVTLQQDELVVLFGTQRSADYMIRSHLEKFQGVTREEANLIVAERRANVTIYDCRFIFRNLTVAENCLRRLTEPPNVSFPKTDSKVPIIIQDSEKASLLPNMEKIAVTHALFDFADAEGSRLYHKRNRYRCYFYSQVALFLGIIFVILGARQTFDKSDRQIISFISGCLMVLGLGMHYMGQKSAKEFSERTCRANQYLGAYVSGLKPHVLLDQLAEHQQPFTKADRELIEGLAEKAKETRRVSFAT